MLLKKAVPGVVLLSHPFLTTADNENAAVEFPVVQLEDESDTVMVMLLL